ncbi:MAG: NADH:ubiquinone reductase (Na(+)-transporting) subunit B [Planctomycetaceae bacterium]|nr:NADH:ubiquinone reductase (Na(+)-transporting) subunit B [Planctomycetaceae bacterium]
MKFIRQLLDRLEPQFHKGGRFERLYPLYEAADTFLYTPADRTRSASHVRDGMDLKRMMITVVVALIPCIYMACWNTGYQANQAIAQAIDAGRTAQDIIEKGGWRLSLLESMGHDFAGGPTWAFNVIHGLLYFLPVFLVTNIAGGTWEVLFGIVRKHDVNEGFLVTGMLFPLTLPATIPLWQVALGISFGVVLGKEVFGGTGKNFLNPALTARAFLYFAYPSRVIGDQVWVALDGHSGPTLLTSMGSVRNVTSTAFQDVCNGLTVDGHAISWMDAFMGWIPGSMGETSALACLIGAAILILSGVGSWRIMAGVLAGSFGLASLLHALGSDTNAVFQIPANWHLVTGGLAFGLVFMATDPVSAAMTETGKWLYGLLIGCMTILIRVVNPAFPEGIMLAILFGNVFAPIIDYFVVQQNIKRRMARNAA